VKVSQSSESYFGDRYRQEFAGVAVRGRPFLSQNLDGQNIKDDGAINWPSRLSKIFSDAIRFNNDSLKASKNPDTLALPGKNLGHRYFTDPVQILNHPAASIKASMALFRRALFHPEESSTSSRLATRRKSA
jgi:hypothetical protein